MAYAQIDYGSGIADLYGNFSRAETEKKFHELANQCFGIRKSIMDFVVLKFDETAAMPDPWDKMERAAAVLKHSGDTIVWNDAGEKIKSEWD